MDIKRKDGDAVLVVTEGRIDLSNSHLLNEKFNQLLEEGFKTITLDFSFVSGIDSSGIGKLLLFQKKLKEHGGKLRIININCDYINKMFKMIHLHKVINIDNESRVISNET